MILNTVDLQNACQCIAKAVDKGVLSINTDTIQMYTDDDMFVIMTSNGEYTAKTYLSYTGDDSINVTIKYDQFLKLVSKIAGDTVSFAETNNALEIKFGKSSYKFAKVFEKGEMYQVTDITLPHVDYEFVIKESDLLNVCKINALELSKGEITKETQKYCYFDELGALTYNARGCCNNSFMVENCPKFLLNERLMGLLSLFTEGGDVYAQLGTERVSDEAVQTIIKFSTESVTLTTKLATNMQKLIENTSVDKLRSVSCSTSDINFVVNNEELTSALGRLLIFKPEAKKCVGQLTFTPDNFVLSYGELVETVSYVTPPVLTDNASLAMLTNLIDLKKTVDCYESETINFNLLSNVLISSSNNIKHVLQIQNL